MLCGDYLMPSDDRAWLGQAFTIASLAQDHCPSSVPLELDLPFISPTLECTALPVVPECVGWAFHRVFGSDGEGAEPLEMPRLPPLSGSKFSVLELSTWKPPPPPASAFGPNELTVLQEVVASLQYRQGAPGEPPALEFLYLYLSLAHDVRQFLPSRWLVLRHLRDAVQAAQCCEDQALRLISSWTELLLRCLGRGPDSPDAPDFAQPYICPCLSFNQYRSVRLDCLQWLAALASALDVGSASGLVVDAMLRVLRSALPPSALEENSFPLVLVLGSGQRIEAQDPQELALLLLALRRAGGEGHAELARSLAAALAGHEGRPRGSKRRRAVEATWARVKIRIPQALLAP